MLGRKDLIKIQMNFVLVYKDRPWLYRCKPNIAQNKQKTYWINSVNIS